MPVSLPAFNFQLRLHHYSLFFWGWRQFATTVRNFNARLSYGILLVYCRYGHNSLPAIAIHCAVIAASYCRPPRGARQLTTAFLPIITATANRPSSSIYSRRQASPHYHCLRSLQAFTAQFLPAQFATLSSSTALIPRAGALAGVRAAPGITAGVTDSQQPYAQYAIIRALINTVQHDYARRNRGQSLTLAAASAVQCRFRQHNAHNGSGFHLIRARFGGQVIPFLSSICCRPRVTYRQVI